MFAFTGLTRRVVTTVTFAGVAAAALSVASVPAFAQDDDEATLDEIVVTARYREESLQQTPIAITAITGVDLQLRGFQDAWEVAYTVPNASMRPAQAAFGNTMTAFIRGIGQYDYNFAFEPGVGVYIDDVYHPFTMGSQIDLLDIERVEVLRGPQGTLFGRGAIGGAIRYVSKPTTGDGSGNFSVTSGEFNRVDIRGSYDFALADNVFMRVAGASKKRDGYQDRIDFACKFPEQAGTLNPLSTNRGRGCKLGTAGGENVTAFRGTLRWVANDAFDVQLTAEYIDDDSETRANTIIQTAQVGGDDLWEAFYSLPRYNVVYDDRFKPDSIYESYATYLDPGPGLYMEPLTAFEKKSYSAVANWRQSEAFGAKLVLSRSNIDSFYAIDHDGSPLNIQQVEGQEYMSVTTAELRLEGRLMDSLDWTLGGFYYDGEADEYANVSLPWLSYLLDIFLPNPFGPCVVCGDFGDPNDPASFIAGANLLDTDPRTYQFVQSRNLHDVQHSSVFGHFVYELSDSWSVNGGFRFSQDEKNVEFDNSRVVNPSVKVDDDHFDWRVGVDWRVNEDFMLYGSAATGYRPGSYNPRPFQATQVVGVDAEEATSYEIGMKADFLDNTLRVNLAAFMFDYETRILPVGGTECPLLDLGPPPVYDTVDPSTPNAVQDSLGNWCMGTVSRTFYENGPADITGYEAELFWVPVEGLTITGMVGTLKWDSPDVNDNPISITDLPIYVPDLNWTIGASYRVPLANGGSITPRADIYGQSEICSSQVSATACADGYELLNASVMWASPQEAWNIALGATNLTDEKFFLNIFDLTAFGQQMAEGQPGRPREWYIRFQRFWE